MKETKCWKYKEEIEKKNYEKDKKKNKSDIEKLS